MPHHEVSGGDDSGAAGGSVIEVGGARRRLRRLLAGAIDACLAEGDEEAAIIACETMMRLAPPQGGPTVTGRQGESRGVAEPPSDR